MNAKVGPVKVWNRTAPCRCGCKGQDPWHKERYSRVITLDEGSTTSGTVKMPYSTQPVRVVKDPKFDMWDVVRSSIVFDK